MVQSYKLFIRNVLKTVFTINYLINHSLIDLTEELSFKVDRSDLICY